MQTTFTSPPTRAEVDTVQTVVSWLTRHLDFPKRLRKLDRLETVAWAALEEAVGHSNVYPIRGKRGAQTTAEVDSERERARVIATSVLLAVEAERSVCAGYGFGSPGHPVPWARGAAQ